MSVSLLTPSLARVASMEPIILSTGMSTIHEVDAAVEIFRQHDCPFVLMHTVSTYPTAENELNLITLQTLRQRYGSSIGFNGRGERKVGSVGIALPGTEVRIAGGDGAEPADVVRRA